MMTWIRAFVLIALVTAHSEAQGALDVASVEATLKYLASDAMAGRDTPSPQQEEAAAYIAKRFKAAGLKPGGKGGSWFHIYKLDGKEWDPKGIQLTVRGAKGSVLLKSGRDVRLWRASGATFFKGTDAVRLDESTSGSKGLTPGRRSKAPILIEVAEDSPLWKSRAGVWRQLSSRFRARGAPWLLVRRGILPKGELNIDLVIPEPKKVSLQLKNVVGIRKGGRKAQEYVLVSSHYDHIGVAFGPGGDFINNGADDDGTGTTAVMHLADALKEGGAKLDRSVAFVCFSGEEKGLLGSKAFAVDPPFPLKNVAVNVNIEMIGRPQTGSENQAWVTGRSLSDFESIMTEGLSKADVKMTVSEMGEMLFRASDNYSLARHGVVAHSISAGYMHPDYHKPTDEVSRIDFVHMTRIIRGIRESLVLFGNRDARPAYNEKGQKATRSRRRLR